jgi:signal transduction histidine kinase
VNDDTCGQGPRLLVVSNDGTRRASICQTLSGAMPGSRVLHAEDRERAWELLHDGGADVLVADRVLPSLGGLELARRSRLEPGLRNIYVILVSEIVPPDELVGAIDECADDYLFEPVRAEELVARVRAGLCRAQAVHRLRTRAHELEQLYARQSDFLSIVSHEIRTPLSAILSSANILLRYGAKRPDSVERFAKVIHQEGQRLTRLINNLLDLAKIEAGLVEWRFGPVSVGDLLEQVRESFVALAGERKVKLDVHADEAAGEVEADHDKVTQVILNLVSNAVKHSADESTVRVRSLPRNGGGVRIEVEDEGPGIPAGMEERIFERFAQLESGDEKVGTGLGLTIARQIVEHHGGRMWAEADRSAGALFVVELPATVAQRATDGPV